MKYFTFKLGLGATHPREEDTLPETPSPYFLPHPFPPGQLCLYLFYVLCLCIYSLLEKGAKWIFWGGKGRFQNYWIRLKMDSSSPLAGIGSRFRVSASSGLVWWGRYIVPVLEPWVQRGKWAREVRSARNVDSFAPGLSLYNVMMTSNMEAFQIIW